MFVTETNLGRRASLHGLVLAGGLGTRMGGVDKGELDLHGEPQAVRIARLLREFCEEVHVSVRAEQTARLVYEGLPLIVDEDPAQGPAMGLRSAMRLYPGAAWLVVAVDMALVDRAVLRELVAARNTNCIATAFVHPDGVPEPLCAIWEPEALWPIEQAMASHRSLRRLLARAHLVHPTRPSALSSVNSPTDVARVRCSALVQLVDHDDDDN